MTAPEVTVTQADRELAAQIMELQDRWGMADLIRAGERDSGNTVQIIARHRTTATTATAETDALLATAVEALEQLACFDDTHGNEWLQKSGNFSAFDEPVGVRISRTTLAAIRAKTGE
jgi:hypothetical protein